MMKKLIALVCALAMMASTAMAVEIVEEMAVYVTFSGDCHVREGAARSFESIDVAKKDTQRSFLYDMEADERGVIWYYVAEGDVKGWVSSKYATLTTEGLSGFCYNEEEMTGVLIENAAMYELPDETLEALCVIEAEDTFEYLDFYWEDGEETWYYVLCGDQTGWVSDKYVEMQNS